MESTTQTNAVLTPRERTLALSQRLRPLLATPARDRERRTLPSEQDVTEYHQLKQTLIRVNEERVQAGLQYQAATARCAALNAERAALGVRYNAALDRLARTKQTQRGIRDLDVLAQNLRTRVNGAATTPLSASELDALEAELSSLESAFPPLPPTQDTPPAPLP